MAVDLNDHLVCAWVAPLFLICNMYLYGGFDLYVTRRFFGRIATICKRAGGNIP
jgi:hypothetical protein